MPPAVCRTWTKRRRSSFGGLPPAWSLMESGASCCYVLLHLVLMRFISIVFFELLLRQKMCMSLAGCRQGPLHRFLGVAAVGLSGLMPGESATLALGQLRFLQLGHAAMPAGVEREPL